MIDVLLPRRHDDVFLRRWLGYEEKGRWLVIDPQQIQKTTRRRSWDGPKAVRWATEAIAAFGPSNVRSIVVNEVGLCSALFLADEPQHALSVGVQTLDRARQLTSRRILDRIVNLRGDLARHRGLPAVVEFASALPQTGAR